MMKKLSALILFIFFCLFVSVKSTSAAILFEDDFSDGDASGWAVEHWTPDPSDHIWETTKWVVNTEKQYGIILNNRQMRTFSTAGNVSWTDYIYKVQMLGKAGVDKNIVFRYQNKENWYGFHMLPFGVYFGMRINGSYSDVFVSDFPFVNDVIYDLEIIVKGNLMSFYANNSPIVENYEMWHNSLPNGKIALYVSTGEAYPSSVWFDNVLVCDFEGPCEPTPTPTPTLRPLILLPGFGASWNHRAIILGETDTQPEDWYITPFVNAYDGLIQTIENAGYTKNDNFFVFNYDWRKPVEEIATDLEEYIGRHPPLSETKINLVGHSFGGLIARTYVQENPEAEVDKLLTLGSPHQGTPIAYYLWEGAQLNKASPAWQRIGLGILLQLHKKGDEGSVATIQKISPSLKDLLPTFPYLKKYGVIKSLSEMIERNLWLENLNTPPLPEPLAFILNTFVGLSGDTPRFINIKERGLLDEVLGRWIDGKPIGEEYEIGDETILSVSARLEPASVTELSGLNHRELVTSETGQQEIMNALSLSPSAIALVPEVDYEPSLVFQLASPVNLTIYGPDGWQIGEEVENNIPGGIYSPFDKLIVIPNPKEGEYEAKITPIGDGGPYRLLIGKITDKGDVWTETKGEIALAESQTHKITFTQDVKKEKLELILLAKKRLEEANGIARGLRNPRGTLISGLVRIKIEETNQIIWLLRRGLENFADRRLERTIINFSKLEKDLGAWSWLYPIPPETESQMRNLIREAKDYLLQAYDLE